MDDADRVTTGEQSSPPVSGGRDLQEPRIMALVLGFLFLAGATIGAFSLILPHPSQYEVGPLWSNVVVAYLAGALIIAARHRLPVWAFHALVLAGTVVVTRAVY